MASPLFVIIANTVVNVSMIQKITVDIQAKKLIIKIVPDEIHNISYMDEMVMYKEYTALMSLLYTPIFIGTSELNEWSIKMGQRLKEKQAEQ